MPAKKKALPAPCPICKRENGTVQIVVFPESRTKVVCRIGHYISEEYKPSKEKRKHLEIDIQYLDKKSSTIRGKIWHNFTFDAEEQLLKKFTLQMSHLQNHIEQYEKMGYQSKRKTITFTPEPIFYELIKKTGWCMRSYKNYHGRKRRYSE